MKTKRNVVKVYCASCDKRIFPFYMRRPGKGYAQASPEDAEVCIGCCERASRAASRANWAVLSDGIASFRAQ